MGGIASNDAELEAILAPAVMEGLQIMGEWDLEPLIQNIISSATHRGSFYQAGGGGSLQDAWTTVCYGGGTGMGEMETYYDSAKLGYNSNRGQHTTPDLDSEGNYRHVYNAGSITDMASLIDQGLGGMLFGYDNPTRYPTEFWDAVIAQFQSEGNSMIRKGLIAAGLPVM